MRLKFWCLQAVWVVFCVALIVFAAVVATLSPYPVLKIVSVILATIVFAIVNEKWSEYEDNYFEKRAGA